MSFLDFVAIKQNTVPETSVEYKSIISFTASMTGNPLLTIDEQIRSWIATMIDKGLSETTRERYLKKLRSLHNDYCTDNGIEDCGAFAFPERLDLPENNSAREKIQEQSALLTKIFPILMQDAKTHPELAVFLYLLFNASSDIEKAIMLRVDEYKSEIPQLNCIIDPYSFHHRRRYVFDLGQSRKRLPQMIREVLESVKEYLVSKGIRLPEPFTPSVIVSLWIAKAREIGVQLSDLRSIIASIPYEFNYLKLVKESELSIERKNIIKKDVAEEFSYTQERWYAMKIKRIATFEDIRDTLKTNIPKMYDHIFFFYPKKEVSKRVGKKIIKDLVPYIPDILFLKVLPNYVGSIDKVVRFENMGWIFRHTNSSNSEYSIIDRTSMDEFQLAIGKFSSDIKTKQTRKAEVEIGNEIVINGGILAGYRGTVYGIKENDHGDSRQIYLKLSADYSIKIEACVDEFLVETIKGTIHE